MGARGIATLHDHALTIAPSNGSLRVSVVIPCLNEAENVEQCVRLARDVLDEHGISGEVLVVDNGSTDGSGGAGA